MHWRRPGEPLSLGIPKMNTLTPPPDAPAPALTAGRAWLVGGGLALVAVASLAAALLLRGPDSSPGARSTAAEPRETIVSTLSPTPPKAAATPRTPAPAPAATPVRTAQDSKAAPRPRSMAEAKRL
jgi:hypothetical protein